MSPRLPTSVVSAAALGVALLVGASSALGAPPANPSAGSLPRVQVALEADKSAGCPPVAELRAQVQACLAPAPAGHVCPHATATVRVLQSAVSLDGRIQLSSGERALGERRLIGQRSCKQVIAAAALAICIGLDAMCVAPQPASPPRRQHAESERQSRLGAVGNLPAVGGPRIGIAILGAHGLAPATSAGLGLSVATATTPWRFAAEARLDAPTTAPFHNGRIGTSLAVAGLSICRSARSLSVCAVQYAGFQHFFGVGYIDQSEEWNQFFATSLRTAWNVWRIGSTGISLWLQADVPWVNVPHEVKDPGSLKDPPTDCKVFPNESQPICQWRPSRVGVTMGIEIHRGGR